MAMLLDHNSGPSDEENLRTQWLAMYSALLKFMTSEDLEKMLVGVSEGWLDKFDPIED